MTDIYGSALGVYMRIRTLNTLCYVTVFVVFGQVSSKLSFAVKLLCKMAENTYASCGELNPGETQSLPCDVAYNPPFHLFIKPSDDRYRMLFMVYA